MKRLCAICRKEMVSRWACPDPCFPVFYEIVRKSGDLPTKDGCEKIYRMMMKLKVLTSYNSKLYDHLKQNLI